MRSPPESGSRTGRGEEIAARQLNPTASASPPRSLIMDEACCDGGGSPESGGASSSASSYGSASRLQKGVRLRRRRQRLRRPLLATGGDGRGAADGAQDLALPLGMSFAAVLAQVLNRSSCSEGRLQPDFLSKMCTSAVKESLTNIYGDRFDNFTKNFEKSFGSTLRTLHLINETPVYEQDNSRFSHEDGTSAAEIKLSGADSKRPVHDIQESTSLSSMDNQIILHAGTDQQLVKLPHNKASPEFDRHILNVFERSLNEQTRSNELKELEIGLNMRKLQLKQSQIALSSYSHMLEKIKISMGFQKASFREEKFRTQMEDTRHAELLRRLIDLLLTAVVFMSVCFGYGTYIYSYKRITAVTAACAAASREPKSWWMPNSVSAFNSGLLFFRCHLIAATRMSFGMLMILLIAWLIFQRSAMTGPNMPITFNVMLLGVLCGSVGRFCVDTLGGDGNVWLFFWEILCFIHLFGNSRPSLLYRMLYGPISVTDRTKASDLPIRVRRYTFYTVLSVILPCLAGLLPFASLSDWNELVVEYMKSKFIRINTEV
ncbi:protein CPR-5-like [Oryza glaberrima]|uniref:CPR5-1 n=1 Tax=Oryza glaberrima TaxID=4538 RepID=I1P4N8_ORYGL|nr:protein CPR-5-like [Oryza glaberrima]